MEPSSAFSPPGGSWPRTIPLVFGDVRVTLSTSKPAARSVVSADAWSAPTTLGTTFWSLFVSSSAPAMRATTSRIPSTHSHHRERSGSGSSATAGNGPVGAGGAGWVGSQSPGASAVTAVACGARRASSSAAVKASASAKRSAGSLARALSTTASSSGVTAAL